MPKTDQRPERKGIWEIELAGLQDHMVCNGGEHTPSGQMARMVAQSLDFCARQNSLKQLCDLERRLKWG